MNFVPVELAENGSDLAAGRRVGARGRREEVGERRLAAAHARHSA